MSWREKQNTLQKVFKFNNFKEAVNFVNKIQPLAEKADHHPSILIYDYKKVKVMLTTHSKGKVTKKDYSLAKQIDGI